MFIVHVHARKAYFGQYDSLSHVHEKNAWRVTPFYWSRIFCFSQLRAMTLGGMFFQHVLEGTIIVIGVIVSRPEMASVLG